MEQTNIHYTKTMLRKIRDGEAGRCIECSRYHTAASLTCKDCRRRDCKCCGKQFISEGSSTCNKCLKREFRP